MENMSFFLPPDCSNGSAESGWTLYLEHSFPSSNYNSFHLHQTNISREAHQELDLSMVSDASSGPQTFPENEVAFPENETPQLAKNGRKKKESKGKFHEDEEQQSFLDDTASSPVFNCNTEMPICSNKVKSLRQSHLSGNQKQKNQWLKGKRFGLR